MATLREHETAEKRILRAGKDMQEKMEKSPVVIIPENSQIYNLVKTLPELVDGDTRMRFGSLYGAIWIATYHEPGKKRKEKLIEEDSSLEEVTPKNIRMQRWSELPSIEHSIRFAGHIYDKYDRKDGDEVIKTKMAVSVMRRLLKEFRTGTMTRQRLEGLYEMTVHGLYDAGFYDAEKSIKQELSEQITLAAQTDSKDRINDLISRSRIASAWLKTTQELIFAKLVREKFPYLQDLLLSERDMERFYVEQGIKGIDNILRLGDGNKEISRAIRSLSIFGERYFKSGRIRANPYRGPAIVAYSTLFGVHGDGQRRILGAYIGDERAVDYAAMPSIQQVYYDSTRSAVNRWDEISGRLSAAREELEFSLDVGDEGLIAA